MFQMVEQRKVWWPVTWDAPIDGGRTMPVKIEMRFILLSPDDAEAIVQTAMALDEESDDGRPQSVRKAEGLLPLIDDWRGVGDEDKQPVDFNIESLGQFFRLPGTFMPVVNAFAACMNGKVEARRKN